MLESELRINEYDVYRVDGLLDLGGLWSFASFERPELKLEPDAGHENCLASIKHS